jgi:hypothetical protein
MMNDPDRRELLHDVLREDEAALREASLQGMIAASRTRRAQRRMCAAALSAAVLLTCGLWFLPGKPVQRAQIPPVTQPSEETQRGIIIRHITEAEMKERLSGFAVAYVGKPGAQKIVLLEDSRH